MNTKNLFAEIPENLPNELFEPLLDGAGFEVKRIVSRGHCSKEDFSYDQDTSEWVLLLKGAAGLQFEGQSEVIELKPGDYLNIPKHQKHRVAWTAADCDTVWLLIHY